jgi:hypothetical protein
MTENRKFALRSVMQLGFQLIAVCCASDDYRIYNPVSWCRHYRLIKEVGLFARWLEKLAFYSAIDFQGFVEEHFWEEYALLGKQNPSDSFWSIRQSYLQTLDRITPEKN